MLSPSEPANCVTPDTQVLTDEGFKPVAEVAERVIPHLPEAVITIHQDPVPGRILFSLDLAMEQEADDGVLRACDVVALTLYNLLHTQSEAFNSMYLLVASTLTRIAKAMEAGATADELANIRLQSGVLLRAEH